MSYYRSSAYRRTRSSAGAGTAIFVILVFGLMAWMLETWWAMLTLGAAHSYDHRIPAFGFMAVAFLALCVNSLVGGALASAGTNRRA